MRSAAKTWLLHTERNERTFNGALNRRISVLSGNSYLFYFCFQLLFDIFERISHNVVRSVWSYHALIKLRSAHYDGTILLKTDAFVLVDMLLGMAYLLTDIPISSKRLFTILRS